MAVSPHPPVPRVPPAVDPAPVSTFPNLGQVASTTSVLPAGQAHRSVGFHLGGGSAGATTTPAGPTVSDVSRRVDGILRSLRGFRFSGDFRYRFDLQDRSANSTAAALQNARSRYRLRLNFDKDLLYGDTSTGRWLTFTSSSPPALTTTRYQRYRLQRFRNQSSVLACRSLCRFHADQSTDP